MFGAQLERERERKMDGNLMRWGGEKEREKKKKNRKCQRNGGRNESAESRMTEQERLIELI